MEKRKKASRGAVKKTSAQQKKGSPERKVEFIFPGMKAAEAYLAGEFNEWNPQSLPMVQNQQGVWNTVISLAPGRYEFKVIADGVWRENETCQVSIEGISFELVLHAEPVRNTFGTQNLVVQVR